MQLQYLLSFTILNAIFVSLYFQSSSLVEPLLSVALMRNLLLISSAVRKQKKDRFTKRYVIADIYSQVYC